jgi:hypothetical protein
MKISGGLGRCENGAFPLTSKVDGLSSSLKKEQSVEVYNGRERTFSSIGSSTRD